MDIGRQIVGGKNLGQIKIFSEIFMANSTISANENQIRFSWGNF